MLFFFQRTVQSTAKGNMSVHMKHIGVLQLFAEPVRMNSKGAQK